MGCGCGKRALDEVNRYSRANGTGIVDWDEPNKPKMVVKAVMTLILNIIFGALVLILGIPILVYAAICNIFGIETRVFDLGKTMRKLSKNAHN